MRGILDTLPNRNQASHSIRILELFELFCGCQKTNRLEVFLKRFPQRSGYNGGLLVANHRVSIGAFNIKKLDPQRLAIVLIVDLEGKSMSPDGQVIDHLFGSEIVFHFIQRNSQSFLIFDMNADGPWLGNINLE